MEGRTHRLTLFAAMAIGLLGISWGAIFVRLAQEAPSLTIAFYRMSWASLVLTPVFFLRRSRSHSRLGQTMVSACALALHFAFWISSLRYTSVAVSVVMVNTAPVWVALWSAARGHERLRWWAWLGIAACVGGGTFLVWEDAGLRGDWRGAFLALVGAWALGAYLLIGRRLRHRLSLVEYVFPTYLGAAVILGSACVGLGLPIRGFSGQTWLALLGLGLIPQVIGHSAYNWALRHLPATSVSAVIVGEPVVATLLAWLVLGEALPRGVAWSGAALLGGIILTVQGTMEKQGGASAEVRPSA
ncbi:MAG TPA: DMT family transporter [Acidobacteriota bacterium]|nr:DMT family transporter [Acidobacteriota bacterium]HRR27499.1 DMT family transporter [Acidobacteriota bacterium]